jgi:hypothetical protein
MIDHALESFNSPADEYWTLLIKYARIDESVQLPIIYNSTGMIDMNKTSQGNISAASALLNPVISDLGLKAEKLGLAFDFWEFQNWLFVNFYWTMLANVGQINSVNYKPGLPAPLLRLRTVNFNDRKDYDSRYNILLNDDLYNRQARYLTTTLLPLLNRTSPQIQPLSQTNRFTPEIATFVRSYLCQFRQWKDPFGFIFSVFTTIWVSTAGPLTVLFLFFTWLETRENPRGSFPYFCVDGSGILPLFQLSKSGP